MENKILLISEVAELLRVSQSTVNRWLGQSRKGIGKFPLPISAAGGKCRWTRDSIEAFIASQESASIIPLSSKQKRSSDHTFRERQEQTDRALNRYRRGNQWAMLTRIIPFKKTGSIGKPNHCRPRQNSRSGWLSVFTKYRRSTQKKRPRIR